eukprot:1545420-Pyramimonas_sp.AAC.1
MRPNGSVGGGPCASALEDIGDLSEAGLSVRKAKSHCAKEYSARGPISRRGRRGNFRVDIWAKFGARLARARRRSPAHLQS